ncbi:MAG: cupin domain-containing protein [Gammaproteobacteria bacterium]|nr:cupin domain-containing protein [Gammaproteobacteria bacterium]
MTRQTVKLQLPAGIDRSAFLRDIWQKRPLLMRAALRPALFALEPDELAGLACDDEVESRLIVSRAPQEWTVRHGPFEDADFAGLPERDWTLLVQDVDKFVPAVARIIESFDFVPSWRVDDIMISYAADGGGVGPHTDAYDVFLMQGRGRRRWRLSHGAYGDDDLVPGLEQRILSRFDTNEDFVLEPGDVLYLPPGVAHWGTADGECMTYSLGFRAPSQHELAADWYQHVVSLAGQTRLDDPEAPCPEDPALVTDAAQAKARSLLASLPDPDSPAFARWFGCYLTEPKPQFQIAPPDAVWQAADLAAWIGGTKDLVRHPAARLAWSDRGDGVSLFVQGEEHRLPAMLRATVRLLAQTRRLSIDVLTRLIAAGEPACQLLLNLLNQGIFEPDPEDE